MQEQIKQFVKISVDTLPLQEDIYEFGSLQVPGQKGFADLRVYFPNKKFIGTDMRKGPGVDILLDLHKIDLPAESVGTALVLDTLEHVEFPRKAMEEVHRVLNQNGIVLISSVFNFPIHNFPYDYWRFTPEAFKSLLSPFNSSFVTTIGKEKSPRIVIGVGFKGEIASDKMKDFENKIADWKSYWENPMVLFRNKFKKKSKFLIKKIVN